MEIEITARRLTSVADPINKSQKLSTICIHLAD